MKSGAITKSLAWFINSFSVLAFFLFIAPIILIHSMNWVNPPLTSFMLSQKASSPHAPIQYEWKNWNELTTNIPLAIIAAKDQQFSTRPGLDLNQLKYVLREQPIKSSIHATSDISKQTVQNLFLWSDKLSWMGLESWLTFLLETSLDKQRILEVYLNIAEFSPGVYGVEAASQKYFHKPAGKLSDNESALLATILSDPASYNAESPSALFDQKQRWIMSEMKALDQFALITDFKKPKDDTKRASLF